MLGPTRIFLSLRHAGDSGLLAAIAYVSALFAATPFLIPVISEEFEVSLGRAGLLSTAQVGAFALVVFVAGRRFRTDRRLLIGSAAASVVLNILSAITPHYSVLLVVRTLAGAAAGGHGVAGLGQGNAAVRIDAQRCGDGALDGPGGLACDRVAGGFVRQPCGVRLTWRRCRPGRVSAG